MAIIICIIMWGLSAFLNRLSVERISPILLQVIVGITYACYIPIALKASGVNPFNYQWSWYSISLTMAATVCSIIANIFLYFTLKGSTTTGSISMLVSMYPIITLLLSVVFLNEQMTMLKIFGLLLMMLGAVLLNC